LSLDEVTDLSGVRITTYFEDDVDRVVGILVDEFLIDSVNSVDKRVLLDPDRFGYLSTHHVAQLNPGRCAYPEYRRFAGLQFEIQTRSILQHAWAEIEHDLGYKSMLEVPRPIRPRFSRLSGLLELADSEFIAIRDKLAEYGAAVLKDISDAPEAVEINNDALLAFAQNDPVARKLDNSIVELGGWVLEPLPDRVGMQYSALDFVGVSTIADLKLALSSNGDRILRFAKKVIPTLQNMSKGSKVGAGVCFLYLGHILASDQNKLINYLGALGFSENARDSLLKTIGDGLKSAGRASEPD
jgi:hypothetical protein